MLTLWVERLTVPSLIWLTFEAAARDARVLYDEHQISPRAAGLLARLGAASRFAPACLDLDGHDERGRALNYRREAELDRVLEPACRQAGGSALDRRTLKSFLANALMFRVTFLVMVEAKAKEGDHEAILARHPANGLILDGWKPGKVRLRQNLSFVKHLKTVAKPLRLLARAAKAALTGPKNAHSMETIRPAAWIQYHPADFQGGYLTRSFWAPHTRGTSYDKVCYFDQPGFGDTAEERRKIRDAGMHWVECRPPSRAAALSAGDLRGAANAFLAAGAIAWWHRWFRLELELHTATWAAVFARYRVKLLVQYLEFEWTQAAQAMALERAGGAMMGIHWSDFPFTTEPIHMTPAHLYWVWGENNKRWLELKGHDCRHILPCGTFIVPREQDRRIPAALPPGFKLALFDGSVSYNIYSGPKSLSRFLLSMLTLLDRNAGWSATLKPKGSPDYLALPDGPAIMALLDKLKAQGRLLVTEWHVGGIGVAAGSDLAVGFGLNSAATLAAVFGA
ncbi:MAG: hypothetical protein HY925_14135, partial [Elusimicrobia bacterium]|nr:hypothetical protein [Elusimicrobiota bacterium]